MKTLDLKKPKRSSKEKLQAYTRYWEAITRVQEEFNSQWIHQNLTDNDVAVSGNLAPGTVRRFRQWGRGNGKYTYSYFHGPAAIFGIADTIGMEFQLRPKRKA